MLLMFFGCQEKATVKPVLDLDKTSISVESESSFAEFSITSNEDWKLSCSEDWVNFSPEKGAGSPDPVNVTITINSNNETDKRIATVEVNSISLSKVLTIKQEGASGTVVAPDDEPFISISPSKKDVSAEETIVYVDVESNVEWVSTIDVEWLSMNKDEGSGKERIEVSVKSNESEQSRSAVICFEIENTKDYLTIVQSGFQPELTLSDEMLKACYEAVELSVSVRANTDWSAEWEPEWLLVSPSSGEKSNTSKTLNISLTENVLEQPRGASVLFKAGTYTKILKIVQDSRPEAGVEDGTNSGIDDWIKDDDELTAN